MLVIRRRPGQSILIGGGVEIEVLEIGPNRVKLGITAPESVTITRKEILLTREQNLAAACGPSRPALAAFLKRFRSRPHPL